MTEREKYMSAALELARAAAIDGEIPVGCVVVQNGRIIGRGRNRRKSACSALAHAEIEAIDEACKMLGDWRLTNCALFVTLEPCPMCTGAIINARIGEVVYGTKEEHTGSCGSVINLFEENYGHKPRVYGGVLRNECAELLSSFFNELRKLPFQSDSSKHKR